MHSNFITPPDFVDDDLHTVTVVDCTEDELVLLARMCECSDEMYNIYLYRDVMDDPTWLQTAIDKSAAVIVNASETNQWICGLEKTVYYGNTQFLSPAKKVGDVLTYFLLRNQDNK